MRNLFFYWEGKKGKRNLKVVKFNAKKRKLKGNPKLSVIVSRERFVIMRTNITKFHKYDVFLSQNSVRTLVAKVKKLRDLQGFFYSQKYFTEKESLL